MSAWTEVTTLLEQAVAAADRVLEGGEAVSGVGMSDLPTEPPTPAELHRLRQELARARHARQVLQGRMDEVRAELLECRHLRQAAGDYSVGQRR